MSGLKNHPVSRVEIPVIGIDPPLPFQIVERPGMGEWGEYGEFRQVQPNLLQEIDQPQDVVLGLAVQSQQDRPLYGDAVVVIALHPVTDAVRGVEDGLITYYRPRPGREVEDRIVLLDRMTAPFLFSGIISRNSSISAAVLGQ